MIDIGLGLGASLAWGSSDFAAAVASRRGHPSRIALLSQVVALPPLLAAAVLTGARFPAPLVWLALAAGLLDAIGITALYSALAVGSISVVARVIALTRKPGTSTGYRSSLTLISAGRAANSSADIQDGLVFGLYHMTI